MSIAADTATQMQTMSAAAQENVWHVLTPLLCTKAVIYAKQGHAAMLRVQAAKP